MASRFVADDGAAQEVLGYILSMAALLLLFVAMLAVGSTVHERTETTALQNGADVIASRLARGIDATYIELQRDASTTLNTIVELPLLPGGIGFAAWSEDGNVTVQTSGGIRDSVQAKAPTLVGRFDEPGLVVVELETDVSGVVSSASVSYTPSANLILVRPA